MPMLSRDVRAVLETVPLGPPEDWSRWGDALVAAGFAAPLLVELEARTGGGATAGRLVLRGVDLAPETVRRAIAAAHDGSTRWWLFDPRCPEPPQRDRLVQLALGELLSITRGKLARLGVQGRVADDVLARRERIGEAIALLGLRDYHFARAVLCDRGGAIAVAGVLYEARPPREERARLRGVLPSLHRRLVLERRLADQPLLEGALDAALEALGVPAWVEDRRGRVRIANAAWQALASRSGTPSAQRFRLTAPGMPPHDLVIARDADTGDAHALVERAVLAWRLTQRQADVLRGLALGGANKEIAAQLGCALHTVELHVSDILMRAGCESRSQLIARVWSGALLECMTRRGRSE